MNRPHLIDSAIFETCFSDALNVDERAGLEQFMKNDLLRVVDEVFDEIERKTGDSDRVLRLDKLEIDLGEASRRQYRYLLPLKLREKLLLALGNMSGSVSRHRVSTGEPIDEEIADVSQLFYFLSHGHLPWYSRGMDAQQLETLLLDALDSTPSSLAEFLRENAARQPVLDRLRQQFPAAIAERALRLSTSPGATPRQRDSAIEAIQAQLVSGLISGDSSRIRAAWPVLYSDDADWLERAVRLHGQRQAVRRHLVAGLASAQFDQLLALLEPGAHGLVQTTIEQAERFIAEDRTAGGDKEAYKARLREYSLGYLLVERGSRFVAKSYLQSLLRKLEDSQRPEGEELLRIVAGLSERIPVAEPSAASLIEAYRRLDRLRSSLQAADAGRFSASELAADAGMLASKWPWLMLRLFRELQAEGYDWHRASQNLPGELLAGLVHGFLGLRNLSAASTTAELDAAIRDKVSQSANRRAYYARILDCLVRDELIDFDAILATATSADQSADQSAKTPEFLAKISGGAGAADAPDIAANLGRLSAMDTAARDRMLQCAELLTTASLSAGISLSKARLEALMWDFIERYADDTGYLFDETRFAARYVDSLLLQVAAAERSAFRPALARSLAGDSLPSTRDLSERLAAGVASIEKPPPVGDDEAQDSNSEPAVLEDIHIANAGAVLLAPYLPRLFEMLELVESGRFVDREAAERAVHCVQFLVDGSTSSPEFRLVLNKLLCGVEPGLPICRGIELARAEIEHLEALLQAVIGHWTALGNTSIAGLRESFLQRGGRLQRSAEAWRLSVEGKSYDMLLDALPWTYSTIRFAWMKRPIYVEWR